MRLQALIAEGPKFHFGDTDELNNEIARGQYAQGFFVGVSATTNIDGITVKSASGIYDTLFGRGNPLLDEEVQNYRGFQKQDPSLAGLEIFAIRDLSTSAELARRSDPAGLDRVAEVQTFNQFFKAFVRTHGTSKGVEPAFLDYRFKRSKEIDANWRRIDNAAGTVNLIVGGVEVAAQSLFNPVGTLVPLAVGKGTELGVRAAGYDELAPAFGNIAGTVSGLGIGAWQNPKVTIGSFIVESTTGMVLRAVGFNDQDAAIFGGAAGFATGGVIASRQASPSVRALLSAQRAALDAKVVLAGDVPRSGGVPPIPGPDIYGPAGHSLVYDPVTGPQAGVAPMFRRDNIGGFEYRSRLIANISDGSGGFTGGDIRAGTPAPTRHDIVPHGDQVSPRPAGYQSHHPESQTALRRALGPVQYSGSDDITIMLHQQNEHVGTFSPQARQRQNPNFSQQLGTPEALVQAYVMLRNVGVSAEETYRLIMKHAAYLFEASRRVK